MQMDRDEEGIETITENSDFSKYIIRASDIFSYTRKIIKAGTPFVKRKHREEYTQAISSVISTMIADCKIPAFGNSEGEALYRKAINTCTEILMRFGKLKDISLGLPPPGNGTSIDGHEDRVSRYVLACASHLEEVSEEEKVLWYFAGRNHDIGKAAMPEFILKKPAELTDDEFSLMMGHPELGAQVLKALETRIPELSDAHRLVLYHHQNWDGRHSYPDHGIKGEEIPKGSRILRICDAFDAMTSRRPWEKVAKGHFQAALEIRTNPHGQFDPDLAERCAEPLIRAFKRINYN
jgi:HD-GYP domain-containing protein (c-di-GMP phosphodiesterase class II)